MARFTDTHVKDIFGREPFDLLQTFCSRTNAQTVAGRSRSIDVKICKLQARGWLFVDTHLLERGCRRRRSGVPPRQVPAGARPEAPPPHRLVPRARREGERDPRARARQQEARRHRRFQFQGDQPRRCLHQVCQRGGYGDRRRERPSSRRAGLAHVMRATVKLRFFPFSHNCPFYLFHTFKIFLYLNANLLRAMLCCHLSVHFLCTVVLVLVPECCRTS